MKLSVIIPAHNEARSLPSTLRALYQQLSEDKIYHELLVVNDNSTDETEAVLRSLMSLIPTLRCVSNRPPNGFGYAIRRGLESFSGDAVAIVMADASDNPKDLSRYFKIWMDQKVDCVFGTRFGQGSQITDYPWLKLIINRMANLFISFLFGLRYYDTTNAFKLYSRDVIMGLQPILSYHFNLTVELPLKAIVRGYSYAITSSDWTNRKYGESKLKIQEMGSRYLFIVLYCFIEKWLSRGDYHSNQRFITNRTSDDS